MFLVSFLFFFEAQKDTQDSTNKCTVIATEPNVECKPIFVVERTYHDLENDASVKNDTLSESISSEGHPPENSCLLLSSRQKETPLEFSKSSSVVSDAHLCPSKPNHSHGTFFKTSRSSTPPLPSPPIRISRPMLPPEVLDRLFPPEEIPALLLRKRKGSDPETKHDPEPEFNPSNDFSFPNEVHSSSGTSNTLVDTPLESDVPKECSEENEATKVSLSQFRKKRPSFPELYPDSLETGLSHSEPNSCTVSTNHSLDLDSKPLDSPKTLQSIVYASRFIS